MMASPFLLLVLVANGQSIPLPTAPQLAYQQREIVALTHFNMGTYYGDSDPSCNARNWDKSGNPLNFAPLQLNISNWVESYKAIGAQSAVLTAKHGCGFCLWNTSVILPASGAYNYTSLHSSYPHDIARAFMDTLSAHHMGGGFYYSLTNNFYLNEYHHAVQNTSLLPGQQKVTQQQYEQIALQQLTELFTRFGPLTEFWFDGGVSATLSAQIANLIAQHQPDMVVFGGQGLTPNFVRWVGTESALIRKPIWSLGTSDTGDPNSTLFCPACCDTTLQEFDRWFYVPEDAGKPMAQLIDMFHDTVGNNGVLEMDFAVDRTGNIAPHQARRYRAFGDWIRACYGAGSALNATTQRVISVKGGGVALEVGSGGLVFDRVLVQEDLSQGQRVRAFRITVDGDAVYESTSVGHKRIALLKRNVSAPATVEFVADDFVGDQVYVANFAVYAPCERPL